MIYVAHFTVELTDRHDLCSSNGSSFNFGGGYGVFADAVKAFDQGDLSNDFHLWSWALNFTATIGNMESESGVVHSGDREDGEHHAG
ncbi:hypothetical protein L208DRAFT_1512278 [Tricholoma matsutake]|nr:hypothetical protein L208DRAFT_1512278 [Tricholoma matsutake 945]